MKSIILFVLSLLLILEKQAAVMGQKCGSKGQLPSGSSQFPRGQKGQHYSGQKDEQHTKSKGSFSIQHTYHVDVNDRDRTQKSQQYDLNAQHKMTKSKQHLGGSQELLNYKQEGRDHDKSKDHFHMIVIHHKGGQAHRGTQNPSQDQGNSPSGKGISSQYSNTNKRLWVHGLTKEQASASGAQKGRTQGGSQSSYVLQTEELVANKQQRETQNSPQNKGHYQNVVEMREEHSSKLQTSLHPAYQDRLQHGPKDIFTTQDELLVYNKNQHQTKNLNQDQEHGQKTHKISYQSSRTEERQLNCGEKSVQKDVSKGGISIQTEEKIHGKSQNQVTIHSQGQEHGHKENKMSYQSSSTEERHLNCGEKGIHKGVSKGSISIQTEEQIHGKSQNQVRIPSQAQEHGHKENKMSYQSSSTEERRLNCGEKGIHKGVSKGSISIQTEEQIHGKSQNQVRIPSQAQEHGHKENKMSYQSSSTEERRLNYGGKSMQKDVSQSSTSFHTEKLVEGKSQIQTPNPNQDQWSVQNAKGKSDQSAGREQDLLSHEQKGRHQQESSEARNIVITEHEVAYDDHLTQQYNEDRNPVST
uniref:Semenogelin-2 n=1 Tax=Hylobates lar TaxID=9580 RepID=SEMG2_HYLLA|nr:RecName: Full=Semenogelin-2; AltName: Full=Semenogelin II; Short=SGII; Flags: Precursor [Hylobates lar]AAV51947.1 semenogelin 2 [Hylobates lar]